MRGIQFFQYKSLQESLHKLKEDKKDAPLPVIYLDTIVHHEKKLSQIYSEYQKAFENISYIISQFEKQKSAVHRLYRMHQQIKKNPKKITSELIDTMRV